MIETKEFAISYLEYKDIIIQEYKNKYKSLNKLRLYSSICMLLLLLLAVSFISCLLGVFLFISSAILIAAVAIWKLILEPKRYYACDINKANFQLARYIFSDNEFFFEMHSGIECKFLFGALGKISIGENYFILWLTSACPFYIPFSAFNSAEDIIKLKGILSQSLQ